MKIGVQNNPVRHKKVQQLSKKSMYLVPWNVSSPQSPSANIPYSLPCTTNSIKSPLSPFTSLLPIILKEICRSDRYILQEGVPITLFIFYNMITLALCLIFGRNLLSRFAVFIFRCEVLIPGLQPNHSASATSLSISNCT